MHITLSTLKHETWICIRYSKSQTYRNYSFIEILRMCGILIFSTANTVQCAVHTA